MSKCVKSQSTKKLKRARNKTNKMLIKTFVNEVNKIFKNVQTDTSSMCTHKFRQRKVTFNDAILYKLLYSFNYKSQWSVCADINDVNRYGNIDKSCYTEKEKNISVDVYRHIKDKLYSLIVEYFSTDSNILRILVDGVYTNTNIDCPQQTCQTSANMGYYDFDNNIPLDFTSHISKKNSEPKHFMDHIKNVVDNLNKHIDMSSMIVVADRGYHCNKLFDMLNKMGLKFIIRIKNNALIITDKCMSKYRLVNFESTKTSRIVHNKSKMTIEEKNPYFLITNINKDEYSDCKIKNYYNNRWTIETFFAYIRKNFKFSNVLVRNEESYNKLLLCIQIVTYIEKIIETIYWSHNRKSKKIYKHSGEIVKCINKLNKSLITEKIYKLLFDTVYGTLTEEKVLNFINLNCKEIKHEQGRSYERTCKTPYYKWYIKKYLSKRDLNNIINYILDNTTVINKNLKMKSKYIKILDYG